MPKKSKKQQDRDDRELLRNAEEGAWKPAHVVLLEFGRKAGILDRGKIIAVWPVTRPSDEAE